MDVEGVKCDWTSKFGNDGGVIAEHVRDQCPFTLIKCKWSSSGCQETFMRALSSDKISHEGGVSIVRKRRCARIRVVAVIFMNNS